MRVHPLFLLFELVIVCSAAESIIKSNRRILHQPLFPSSSSPPPVEPPPPPDTSGSYRPDQPFFPEVAPNGARQSPGPPTNGSDPIRGATQPANPTKKVAIVVVSVGTVTLAVLCALSFYLYRHKRRRKRPVVVQAPKSEGRSHAGDESGTAPDPSSFLYLGTVDTHSAAAAAAAVDDSPPHPVKKSDRYRPSPDLQPLPPLRPIPPPANSSDEEEEEEGSSHDMGFYTPHGSIASTDDGFSTPVSRQGSRNSATKRTSSSSRRSRLPPRTIIPSIKPPHPPPPPPPLEHTVPSRPKFGPPPPPPNLALLQSISSQQPHSHSQHPLSPALKAVGSIKENVRDDWDRSKPRLKPLHWDKVRATSDRATVWDQLQPSSFELNEDRMERLFGSNSGNNGAGRKSVLPPTEQQQYRIMDPKKSQNIAILLRALNVTRDEVSQALLDGNPEALGADVLETLAKMAPTKEEEIKLKGYKGDNSKLGSAERFLKAILDVPFAFRRVEAMQYRATFDAEVNYLRKSFGTLEEASRELRNSRLFLKLLEAVLTTGNRMNIGTNRGGAQSFKLDTLLKLVDIKGVDRKTTLLHFVVQEMSKSEGTGSVRQTTSSKSKEEEFRRQGLQVVSGLSREIPNVKLAAGMDSDVLHNYVTKLETGVEQVQATLVQHEGSGIEDGFHESMKAFVGRAKEEICRIKEDERRALSIVREVTEYIHGDAAKEESHPLRIFVIVRDFLLTLDGVCKDVGAIQERPVMGAARSFQITSNAPLAVHNRYKITRNDSSSEESSSP